MSAGLYSSTHFADSEPCLTISSDDLPVSAMTATNGLAAPSFGVLAGRAAAATAPGAVKRRVATARANVAAVRLMTGSG